MNREEIKTRLLANGNDAVSVNIFLDLLFEYLEAMEQIKNNGVVCADPRSGAPLRNPFVAIRDNASAQLLKMRNLNLSGIDTDWSGYALAENIQTRDDREIEE